MADQWDLRALNARTKDRRRRRLHEAGSPNAQEVAAYKRCLIRRFGPQGRAPERRCVILGMTPALRGLAHRMGYHVTCFDRSPAAIAFFCDWGRPPDLERERVIEADWLELPRVLEDKVAVVLGDGAFGNLLTVEAHRSLLDTLRRSLAGDGLMVFRKILIPRGFPVEEHTAERLLEAFRSGRLSDAEFGFAMRIWGSYRQAYDPGTLLLDNRIVFERYAGWHGEGRLSRHEYEIVERYYFGGLNLIPPQDLWEQLLRDQQLSCACRPLSGKAWYRYYPIYTCHPG